MARIRTIKPELWSDEKIGSLTHGARLLFIGSFNFADDYGFLFANPTLLKSQIFPYDETLRIKDVKGWIDEILEQELYITYSHNNNDYYIISNFLKHQKIDKRFDKSYIGKGIVKDILATALITHRDHTVTTP